MQPTGTRIWLAVALGGALGALLRYLASVAALSLAGPAWPWGTLFANVAGSLLIGLYARLTGEGGRIRASLATHHFVITGFCGGFTTFSIFSLETLLLFEAGAVARGSAYIAVSLLTWLLAAWLGDRLGDRLNRRTREIK